jgi:hypothetical protein
MGWALFGAAMTVLALGSGPHDPLEPIRRRLKKK